jgi:WD40 repeat protein
LTIWDADLRTPLEALATNVKGGCKLAWSPDNRWIAISGNDQLSIVERKPFHELKWVKLNGGGAPLLAFSSDGSTLLALWRRATSEARPMTAFQMPSLDQSPSLLPRDWRFPWSGSVATGADLKRLLDGFHEGPLATAASEIRANRVRNSAISADRRTIVLNRGYRIVEIFRESDWQARVQIGAAVQGGEPLTLTPDGRTLAISHVDGQISLWSTVTGQQYCKLDPRLIAATISFSPDGRKLLAIGTGPSHREEIVIFDGAPQSRPKSDLHSGK